MKVEAKLVGNTVDTDPGLLLCVENKRYLFNVGEGLQRYSPDHNIRMQRIQDVFITHIGPEALGGLLGMVLKYAKTLDAPLHIHGPRNTALFFLSFRHFMNSRRLSKLDITEYEMGLPPSGPDGEPITPTEGMEDFLFRASSFTDSPR